MCYSHVGTSAPGIHKEILRSTLFVKCLLAVLKSCVLFPPRIFARYTVNATFALEGPQAGTFECSLGAPCSLTPAGIRLTSLNRVVTESACACRDCNSN